MILATRLALLLALTGAVLGCATNRAQAGDKAARPPNIVIILADDAGYADFGFQGSREFATPNLDALARQGVVYEAAYATMPFCSPSRAGLLTGRYTQRFGYEFNLTHEPTPGVDPAYMGLAVEERTIGDLFQAAGYATIAIGKWHVGSLPQFHPNARGFGHFYGFLGGSSSYFPQAVRPGSFERDGAAVQPEAYLSDDLAREAAAQIAANRDRPFVLYLAFNAVHTPMEALAEDEARFSAIADPQRRRLAAMTWGLDRATGTVLQALRTNGLVDNTLVVFTNDNGGDRIGLDASNAPLRGTKGTLLEGGIRVPFVVRYPDGRGAGERRSEPVSLMDILPTSLDLAGLGVPSNLDGRSLVTAQAKQDRALFWRYDNMAAMRDGDWKMLRYPDRPAELYDLSRDIGETRNLAETQPERLRAMLRRLFAWEGKMSHPRWNTGSFWSQEDVRRYSEEHIATGIARSKAELEDPHPQ
ncbi:sulfatase-like hydrolase/transferase [Altererythrobacter sp. BO-6]|uniref:sulfatase-like hydrolase/transferase n=1 Tax=Altererythrobacter sp. BO-6 TaxID=2604537 RepID=UPI0013E1AA7C|nr:sulfatase-like hydrolase/transferase [Altererythrobacter sp. BO-6]QIG53528.1 sulfatase-like hydrolase/transferase [Altererythrobacter sp. BO-6]